MKTLSTLLGGICLTLTLSQPTNAEKVFAMRREADLEAPRIGRIQELHSCPTAMASKTWPTTARVGPVLIRNIRFLWIVAF